MSPKISIIVPVYNVEKYLSRCIESILNQTFREFELILVNDGSTDKSGYICNKYKNLDERVIVINKENGGASSARNYGLNIARGEYIGFVDSDDYVHKYMFQVLYDNALKYSSDITMCNYKIVYDIKYEDFDDLDIKNYTPKFYSNIEAQYRLYDYLGIVLPWNKLYKKSIFEGLRYEEGKIHEDEIIIHKLLYKANLILDIPLQLYFYEQREGSVMNSKYSIKNLDKIYALRDRVLFYKKVGLDDLRHKSEYHYTKQFFVEYFNAKYKLTNSDEEINQMRKEYIGMIKLLLKNPLYNIKEKLLWILFCVNPYFYEKYHELKGIKLV